MSNRLRHLLADWNPGVPAPEPPSGEPDGPRAGYPLPPGISMLMPVELCINGDLLVSLLSASILEINRHRRRLADDRPADPAVAEMEAALQQQLAFRAWARGHPSRYIRIALYPVTELGTTDEPEEFGEF